jgi:hypothetical protein
MATKPVTTDRNTLNGAVIYRWADLGNADDGSPVSIPYAADNVIQIEGTFGGATCVFEGSNDGTNWHTLHSERISSNSSMTLSVTSAALRHVLEQAVYLRPKTSGGTGTSLTVTMVSRAMYGKVGY